MRQILQAINNQTYKRIYLFYGEENYLRLQYKDKLKKALCPAEDDMNYSYYQGKDVNVAEVIDMAQTMPFLSEYRAIFLENTGFVKDGNEALTNYVSEGIPDSTVIVMTERAVDKRNKLFKAISKCGRCVEFETQNEATLKTWIAQRCREEKKAITNLTVGKLLETVGTDMTNISTELEKLFAYTMGRSEITVRDIEDVCCVRLENKIFDMIGHMGLRHQKEALKMYNELLSQKESPFGVLALIRRQFDIMLQIDDMRRRGVAKREMASRVGLAPFIVDKYLQQVDCFTTEEIKVALTACADVDYDIKRGNIKPEFGVELLIIENSFPR